jgi:aspartyl-tRNA(Asn)/glutamyl-tRNA(Gln) amidotransferase subunit B
MRILNDEKITIEKFQISSGNLSSLVNMIAEGSISNNIAKEVYSNMLLVKEPGSKQQDPELIVKDKNLLQVTDSTEIEKIVKKVIDENPSETARYKGGETKLLGFFVGKVMKESKGKANPKTVNELLILKLG